MNVEVLGRQYNITPGVRKEVEAGLEKLTKILGDSFKSKVILRRKASQPSGNYDQTPRQRSGGAGRVDRYADRDR